MTRLDAAEELADLLRLHLAIARNLQAAMGNHCDLTEFDVPRFEDELGRSFPLLQTALDNFSNEKDWMLLEGETTSVQCLLCLRDSELSEDSCRHCGNEFTGIEEYRKPTSCAECGDSYDNDGICQCERSEDALIHRQ